MSGDAHAISDRAALRQVYKSPSDGAVRKVLARLDRHARAYLARSPFAVIATAGANGTMDASPKGGPPGFIVALDDATLLIPDWPGNNRLDSLENILENPRVGVLSFLPGMNEMLRINGRARITTDPDLRTRLETEGRLPITVIVVTVEEVYLHCSRALQRSALWDPTQQVNRKDWPTMGAMLADQVAGYDGAVADRFLEANKTSLY